MSKYGPFPFPFLLFVSTPITQQAALHPEISKSIVTKAIFITLLVLFFFRKEVAWAIFPVSTLDMKKLPCVPRVGEHILQLLNSAQTYARKQGYPAWD